MESGVVGNNNQRSLDLNEFRGFFLSDPLAPLIFINSKDSASPKTFYFGSRMYARFSWQW